MIFGRDRRMAFKRRGSVHFRELVGLYSLQLCHRTLSSRSFETCTDFPQCPPTDPPFAFLTCGTVSLISPHPTFPNIA